jgi:hypothetical protein
MREFFSRFSANEALCRRTPQQAAKNAIDQMNKALQNY